MNRHFRNVLVALASVSALAVAGAVVAEVPDEYYDVVDNDEPVARADVNASGNNYRVYVIVQCADVPGGDSPEGSRITFASSHVDRAKLKKNKLSLEQSQKENQGELFFDTGSGAGLLSNRLSYDKIDVSGDVKTGKSPFRGSFEGSARSCVCDDTYSELYCESFAAQLSQIATDCADLKTVKIDLKDGTLKKLSVKGKGDAEIDP